MPLARLSALLLLTALCTSRVALVLHELCGHAAVAVALGADVVDFRLFLFGGGYVVFDGVERLGTAAAMTVFLGGIAVQLGAAAALLVWVRWRPPGSVGRAVGLCAAMLLVGHGGFYLAAGVHHGYGDGRLLHFVLGDARVWLVAAAAVAVVAGTFVLARSLAANILPWLSPLSRRRQLLRLGAAALLAAGGHAALAFGEAALASDRTYEEVMVTEATREAARDFEKRLDAERARGVEPSEAERDALWREVSRRHRPLPFDRVLLALLALALVAGALWARPAAGAPRAAPSWRDLAPVAGACAAALLAVLALRVPWWR
jgi:hypothetical protein